MAFALLFFRMDRFAGVIPTFSASSPALIFRRAIITSMFTAIMFTRGLVNLIFGGRNVKKLWI